MAQQQRRGRLQVVANDRAPRPDDGAREAYWQRLQALRVERKRLRAS